MPTGKNRIELSSIQKTVYDFIFENVGMRTTELGGKSQEAIALDGIVDWCKTNHTKAYNFFQELQDIVFAENLKEGYFETKSREAQKDYKPILIGILLSVLNIFLVCFCLFL